MPRARSSTRRRKGVGLPTAVDSRIQTLQARVHAGERRALSRRTVDADQIELRDEGDKLTFIGHAAVFDRLSEDLGGFKERIQRGAFRKVLDANADVRFLFNHNSDTILARTASGTMELREDPKGLRVYAELAPTTFGKDLRVLIKRGDVSQMSFGFRVQPDGKDHWEERDGDVIRTIISFGELLDVGPVTFAAYSQTDASMRALSFRRYPRLAARKRRLALYKATLR